MIIDDLLFILTEIKTEKNIDEDKIENILQHYQLRDMIDELILLYSELLINYKK